MSNYRGPIEVVTTLHVNQAEGKAPEATGVSIKLFATTNPGGGARGERVEVELRAGRGGTVFVEPVVNIMDGAEIEGLPPDARSQPRVHPEARTRPFDISDFGPPTDELRPREPIRPPLEPETDLDTLVPLAEATRSPSPATGPRPYALYGVDEENPGTGAFVYSHPGCEFGGREWIGSSPDEKVTCPDCHRELDPIDRDAPAEDDDESLDELIATPVPDASSVGE